jgi:sulfoxide reductase heme-binding subunit YedZ
MALVRLRPTLVRAFIWFALALPAALMLADWSRGVADAMDLLHPSGETSARLLIAALAIGPLAGLFGPTGWTQWLLRRRRWLGVASFGYALLHLLFYLDDMGYRPGLMLDEIDAPAIWTGWLALALMLPPALASSDAAMRRLRRAWKNVQRLAFPVAMLTLVHWALIAYDWLPGLAHFVPLATLHLAARLRTAFLPQARRTMP